MVEQRLAETKGPLTFFALFLPEDYPDKWDVLVAAPWVETDMGSAMKRVADEIRKELTDAEMYRISRIVLIEMNNPFLPEIWRNI